MGIPSWIAGVLFPSETAKVGDGDGVTVTTTYTGGTYLDSDELYRSTEVQAFFKSDSKPAITQPSK